MHLLRFPTPWRRPLAAGLAVLVFGLSLLASAPGWHQELHPDAHEAEHSCAITLFADGLTPASVGVVLAFVAGVSCTIFRPRSIDAIEHGLALRPPVRGPPAA